MDAESCGLAVALRYPNVELRENIKVERLLLDSDGKRLAGVETIVGGERKRILARIVILSAGAVNSAALLLASTDEGIANRSDTVGRHFMNHNCSAVLAIDPRTVNDSVYQKTLGINDFYLDDGRGGPPLGNIQLLGRVTAPILKSSLPRAPEWALSLLTHRAVDWYAMSEDLPNSRKPSDRERRGDSPGLEAKQLVGARGSGDGLQGAVAGGGLSNRAFKAF